MVILKQNYQLGMASGLLFDVTNIEKVGRNGEIDILEYGREPDIILLLYTHRTVMENNQHKKTRIEDIGIISMLWIGLKIK
jgi:hypothetical protein